MKEDVTSNDVVVSKKLKEIITPLNAEELEQLSRNIVAEGCRDPLIVWEKKNGELILVDGHNRLEICLKYNIPYKINAKEFKDMDQVISWMINNQLGRRNLNKDQMSYYRGLKYENLKKGKGGYQQVKSKGQNEPLTAALLANEFNTSESTIKRDAKFARGLDRIGASNPILKQEILVGKVRVKKSDILLFADASSKFTRLVKNEADLHNKAKILRNELLKDIEDRLSEKDKKIQDAQKKLQEMEPVFSDWNDRVKRVKGNILSAVNQAIENRDTGSLERLKQLIEKLEVLLLEN